MPFSHLGSRTLNSRKVPLITQSLIALTQLASDRFGTEELVSICNAASLQKADAGFMHAPAEGQTLGTGAEEDCQSMAGEGGKVARSPPKSKSTVSKMQDREAFQILLLVVKLCHGAAVSEAG